MTITEVPPTAIAAARKSTAAGEPAFRPLPVWFFAFEGLMGAAYDVLKAYPRGWVVLVVCAAVNVVLARTVLRGRLKAAKAMLRSRRTRWIACGLVVLRGGTHLLLIAAGMHVASGPAHLAMAAAMCITTVALLAFDQRVVLRAPAAN